MGPPGLLAEGKDRPQGHGGREEDPGQAGPAIHQQEIERHQGEARRGMRARKAGGARQRIRPVLEQVDIRMNAAKSGDIARAVHVGDDLEDADDRGAERDGDHEVSRLAAQRTKSLEPVPAEEHDQRSEADHPDQGRPNAMNQALGPPGVFTDPHLRAGVEEPGVGDEAVEVHRTYGGGRENEEDRRQPEMEPPEPRHSR